MRKAQAAATTLAARLQQLQLEQDALQSELQGGGGAAGDDDDDADDINSRSARDRAITVASVRTDECSAAIMIVFECPRMGKYEI